MGSINFFSVAKSLIYICLKIDFGFIIKLLRT